MNGLFCIANLLNVSKKKPFFFNFMDFNLFQTNKVKYSHNVRTKRVLIERTFKLEKN